MDNRMGPMATRASGGALRTTQECSSTDGCLPAPWGCLGVGARRRQAEHPCERRCVSRSADLSLECDRGMEAVREGGSWIQAYATQYAVALGFFPRKP